MPRWATPDTTDETLRVLQDEAVSQALVDRSIPDSKIRREPVFIREQVSGPSAHINVPLDGNWRGVSTLLNALGGRVTVTPRSSGIIAVRYTTSWYAPTGTQSVRGTFRWGGSRISPDNQPGGDPTNGLLYVQDMGAPLGQWAPATLEHMDRVPVGEPLEIEPEFIGNGGGTGFLLGASGHSYLYVWEMF